MKKSKIVSADEAIRAIEPGMRVYMPGNAGMPRCLWDALIRRGEEDEKRPDGPDALRNVEVVRLLGMTPDLARFPKCFLEIAPFIGGAVRKAVNEGLADSVPIFLKDVPWLLGKEGPLRPDVSLLHVSRPDKDGYCTLGVGTGLDYAPARSARIVVAETNPRMPSVCGRDAKMHVKNFDYIVEAPPYELTEIPFEGPNDVSRAIGRHIASLIPDGATLQLGIGSIPDAVLECLKGHKDLGLHSEAFSDGVVNLVKAGIINGKQSTLSPGHLTVGIAIGHARLYDFLHQNDLFEFHRQDWVNDPRVISRNRSMISINAAIEVDLTGQVCADSIMPRYPFFSGVGGQVDFVRGAREGKGGKSFIAMASTVALKDNSHVSKIVPMLKPGSSVTTSRNDVHYVVTEYGAIRLFGLTMRQRVKALIGLAHPDFREALAQEAYNIYHISV